MTPVAFLVINSEGEAKILNIGENTGYAGSAIMGTVNGIDAALSKAPEIIDKIKFLFKSKKNTSEKETEDAASVIYTDET